MFHGPGRRLFARGDFRLILLDLIAQSPKHGYSLIEELERLTGGLYAPSPGIIYPALQFLEEGELIEATQDNNRKIYRITQKGTTLVNDNRDRIDTLHDRIGRFGSVFGNRGGERGERGSRWGRHEERDPFAEDRARGDRSREERPHDDRTRGRAAPPQDFVAVALTSLEATAALARGRVPESFLVEKLKEVERTIATAAMEAGRGQDSAAPSSPV